MNDNYEESVRFEELVNGKWEPRQTFYSLEDGWAYAMNNKCPHMMLVTFRSSVKGNLLYEDSWYLYENVFLSAILDEQVVWNEVESEMGAAQNND